MGDNRLMRLDARGIRWLAVAVSVLLSLWVILINDKINADGALYVDTAQRILAGDWAGAYRLYRWPFFSALIALVSRITGLHPEAAAMAINLALAAVLVYAFLRLAEDLGGARKTLWFAALVILTFPYLNEKRADVVRDIGYWACYLSGVLLFLRFTRSPTLIRASAWWVVAVIAALFRVEGLVFLVALPLALWFRRDWPLGSRLRHFVQVNTLTGLLLALVIVAVYLNPELTEYRGRLLEPLDRLRDFWWGVTTGLDQKAELLRTQVLEVSTGPHGPYAGTSATKVLVGGLIAIVLYKLVKLLSLYCLLPLFRRFREPLQSLPPDAILTMAWLGLINLSVIMVFVVHTFYLSTRFLMPLALTLLVAMPFVLTAVHNRWQQLKPCPLHKKWGYPLIALWLLWMAIDGVTFTRNKAYLREAGTFIRNELPAQARVYTNASLLHYYSGQGIAWEANWQYEMPPPKQAPLETYDYAAVEIKRGRFPAPWEEILEAGGLEEIKAFENRRGDGVRIYRIRQSP